MMINRTMRSGDSLRARLSTGFTLAEILVVVLIVSVLLFLTAPQMLGAIRGARLTQAGDMVLMQLSEAQEIANTMGRPVEVRFYKSSASTGSSSSFNGLMIMEYYQPGESDPRVSDGSGGAAALANALAVVSRPLSLLPVGTLISGDADLSTLTTDPALQAAGGGTPVELFQRKGVVLAPYTNPPSSEYQTFTMLPGGTNLSAASGKKWFVTVVDESEISKTATSLRNFYTVQIDPVTGRLSRYRPN